MTGNQAHLRALIEAVIYLSPEPVPLRHLARAVGETPEIVQELITSLVDEYESAGRGIRIRMVGGGYQVGTKPELSEELKAVIADLQPPRPLSKQALETVAVIAMLQPVTAQEIQIARRVRNSDAIRTLLRRKLIAPAGRARTRGKPLQYRTTPRFLIEFGLNDLSELPKIEAFQQVPVIQPDCEL